MKTPCCRRLLKVAFALILVSPLGWAETSAWKSKPLLDEFYAEGSAIGDLNGDGKADLAYGPFWFAGPDFGEPQRFSKGEPFVANKGYSDNFFSFIQDFNADGQNDILIFGFPGKEARLYLNPGTDQRSELWPVHIIADQVANESPHLIDLIPGGFPEIVCARGRAYGYYQAGSDATQPWTWHAISPVGEAATPFGHGLGVGDINGDGRLDVLEKMFWYEQPEAPAKGEWTKHRWALVPYGGGGAQILVDDVDGDGDADIITSLNAHAYGLAWFEQDQPGKFARHDIMGKSSTENPYGVAFSQLHAMALADFDGDGRKDFVTGKRYLAHQGKDPGGLQDPVVYIFRNVETEQGIEFVPHLVHTDSGVGVEVKVGDLNGDGAPDIVSGNKKGLAIHLRDPEVALAGITPWDNDPAPQSTYGSQLTPEEAVARYEVPEGFSVDLIASEPELTQPIAMCFDARGRIWVVEGHTYPVRKEGGWDQGKDRVIILEDTDADGTFETKKTFLENINLASGIEVGFGGVYIGAPPYLLFFPDKDQDDVPDGDPEILLDGWAWQDTHETLNAFTWGPDGWLYGCHGVFTHSRVGKPGTPDDKRQPINAGVWRFHPTKHQFEVWAWGTSNPWGVDFNEYGDWFVSACVIPHFYHLSQGGRYFRQAGQHFNPYIYDDIETIADHGHFLGDGRALWAQKRGGTANIAQSDKNFTNAVGGGHAHCGLAIYEAPEFPAEFRGRAFFHNLHGHRMVTESIGKNGSSYIVRHSPDFARSNDHNQIGVGVMLGPDGALYSSDWQDSQTCHHRDVNVWDRSNGRLYRLRYGDIQSTVTGLMEMSMEDLVTTLAHENRFHANQARRLLQEGSADGRFERQVLRDALTQFAGKQTSTALRLRAYWAMHGCGVLDEADYLVRLADPDPYLRAWTLQFLGESKVALSDEALAAVTKLAEGESSSITRRYLASLLQRIPHDQRWTLAEHLISERSDLYDPNIPLLCWYGIEPLVLDDPQRALALSTKSSWPQIQEFIARRAAGNPEGRSALMTSLSKAPNGNAYLANARVLLQALSNLPRVESPEGWAEAKQRGMTLAKKQPEVRQVVDQMGARFADPEFFPVWRAVVRDGKKPASARIEALEILTAGKDPELGTLARESLEVPALRSVALTALQQDRSVETAEAIVKRLDAFPLKLRNEAVNLLAGSPQTALVLLRAVDSDAVDTSMISPALLDQFERFENEEISGIIEANWVRGSTSLDLKQLAAAIKTWENKLNSKVMARANASRGRELYQVTCGTCHQLFGEGIALGPDLTGSNRADLGYLLENVLAPSAVVGKDYMLTIFTQKDGAVISGMVREETGEFAKIAMPGGSVVDVNLAEVASRQELPQSLMPAGLFDAMKLEQVADLVAYLGSPSQVPLPGEKSQSVMGGFAPPASGVLRMEGEDLLSHAKVTGGGIRAQVMTGFGKGLWSGESQLWWTGGQPDNSLTLTLKDVKPGAYDLTLFPTTAKDYAKIKVLVNGQIQEADLFTQQVLPAKSMTFPKVQISPTEPLKVEIQILGANPEALPRYMVGLDRVELSESK